MARPTRSVAASIATSLALIATPASAIDGVIYFFNTTVAGAFGDPPYGSVTLLQNGPSVDFMVEPRQDQGINLRFAGGGSNSLFSFNATGVAASDIRNIASMVDRSFVVTEPGVETPFGLFTFGISCNSNCTTTVAGDFLAFTVINATLADFQLESTGGRPNAQFAVNAFMTGSSTSSAVAHVLDAAPIPEPQTYALMLAGLAATGFIARRRRVAARSRPNPGRWTVSPRQAN